MRFEKKYPVPLNELLLAPIVFRAGLTGLERLPLASGAGMADLAAFGGFADGAIRTAMSRLRSSGLVTATRDADGVTRYQLAGLAASVTRTVQQGPRPAGYTVAIFSFSRDDARERQVVRDALELHGFQRLGQNAYLSGRFDLAPLEALLAREGLSEHVFLFHAEDRGDPRLLRLFDVEKRAVVLRRFESDLGAWLTAPGLDDDTFARRFFFAGPTHYRFTFVEEPPFPAQQLPRDYPLRALVDLMPRLAARRRRALAAYYRRVHAS